MGNTSLYGNRGLIRIGGLFFCFGDVASLRGFSCPNIKNFRFRTQQSILELERYTLEGSLAPREASPTMGGERI